MNESNIPNILCLLGDLVNIPNKDIHKQTRWCLFGRS